MRRPVIDLYIESVTMDRSCARLVHLSHASPCAFLCSDDSIGRQAAAISGRPEGRTSDSRQYNRFVSQKFLGAKYVKPLVQSSSIKKTKKMSKILII